MTGQTKRALTYNQLIGIGFDTMAYSFPIEGGVFIGALTAKCWGTKRNLTCYFDLDNGDKIKLNTWWEQNYMDIDILPVGTSVKLTMEKNKKGFISLTDIEVLE